MTVLRIALKESLGLSVKAVITVIHLKMETMESCLTTSAFSALKINGIYQGCCH